jgi:diphosphoinositol-polyphosphate diphosphatase
MLGSFAFQSGKQERLHNVHQGRCTAHMFIMHVAEELSSWPESTERQRAWVGDGLEARGARRRLQLQLLQAARRWLRQQPGSPPAQPR